MRLQPEDIVEILSKGAGVRIRSNGRSLHDLKTFAEAAHRGDGRLTIVVDLISIAGGATAEMSGPDIGHVLSAAGTNVTFEEAD